jgi:hypothetical protein
MRSPCSLYVCVSLRLIVVLHLRSMSYRKKVGDTSLQNSLLFYMMLYRDSQEERSIFWEVIVSIILSKKHVCTFVLFRTVSEIELFHCTDDEHAIKSNKVH